MAIKDSVDRLHERRDVRERNEEQLEVLNWLSSIDFASQQNDHLKRRQTGTGQWLLDSDEFQHWLETPGKTLFCPGIPGAGKTVLTALVVDHLLENYQSKPAVGIAYIYFNFRRKDEQKLDDLLACLLKQLIETQPSIPSAPKELFDKHKFKRTRPSTDELNRALQSVARSYERTFIVVDALDECEVSDGSRTRFIEHCFALQARCRGNLFMTSRFLPDITEKFSKVSTLEIRAKAEDVQKYLASQMSRLPRFVGRDPGIQAEIKCAIVEAVDGMYGKRH